MQLTPHQERAKATLIEALASGAPEVSLSGPAGSGKTTMAKQTLADLVDRVHDVAIVAPTNKAAKVLNDKGLFATTIHSQFFIADKQPGKKLKFYSAAEYVRRGLALPEGKRDFAEIIAIDEASMLNSWVLGELRKMCNQLILIGDQHQLPPVNDLIMPAGYFNTRRHTAELSEILRQSEGSPILDLATAIRTGAPFEALMRQFFPIEAFSDVAAELPQFIAFTNKERARVNRLVRARHGLYGALPEKGEKVICASNYDDLLLNGTEATVASFEWNGTSRRASILLDVGRGDRVERREASICMLAFLNDLQNSQRAEYNDLMTDWERQLKNNPTAASFAEEDLVLRFGYCITAHAAQGSEYQDVVVIDQTSKLEWAGKQNGSKGMSADEFVRRWMYTAVTRARQNLIIAPEWWAANVSVGRAAA